MTIGYPPQRRGARAHQLETRRLPAQRHGLRMPKNFELSANEQFVH